MDVDQTERQRQRNAQAARRTRIRRKERISALKSNLHTTQVRIQCLQWYEAMLLRTMREHGVALPPACQESLDEIDVCLQLAAHDKVGVKRECTLSYLDAAKRTCVASTHDKVKREGGTTAYDELVLLEMTSPLTQ